MPGLDSGRCIASNCISASSSAVPPAAPHTHLTPPTLTKQRRAEMAAQAAELHNTLHAGGMGVDAPQPSDIYLRLAVDRCFYVGQLGGGAAADVLAGDEYRAAATDPLRTCAAPLARQMNADRPEDMLRIRWGPLPTGGRGGLLLGWLAWLLAAGARGWWAWMPPRLIPPRMACS